MSLNLSYSMREAVVGLRRARLATGITVSIISITLTMLGLFLVFTVNIQRLVDHFRERMTLEVFIDNTLEGRELDIIEKKLSGVEGVEEVKFVSKEQALHRFIEEFGEDPLELLGENPFPASFQVKLIRNLRTSKGLEDISAKMGEIQGVDEVIYHGTLLKLIDRYGHIVIIIDLILFLIVLISAILLVSNTMRLTIISQKETIMIMELVGATDRFIRRPYLIEGMLQGGIGGGISSLTVFGLVKAVSLRFPRLLEVHFVVFLIPFILGICLGFMGSRIGLKRFL